MTRCDPACHRWALLGAAVPGWRRPRASAGALVLGGHVHNEGKAYPSDILIYGCSTAVISAAARIP